MAKRRTTVEIDLQERQEKLQWHEAVEQFLNGLKLKGLSYHTRRWHKENLQAVFKSLQGNGHPADPSLISAAMLKDVFLSMTEKGLSPTTINHRMRSIKQLLAFLVKEAFLTVNPALQLEKQKVRQNIIQAFTDDQVVTLLSMPDKSRFSGLRDYAIMVLLLDTGIRLSELCSVRLVDLRMAQNELIIAEGKGGKQRRVFYSHKAKETLLKYIKARGDIPGNTFLFVTVENLPMRPRNIQERLSVCGESAGLDGVRVSPHTFRHTFAKMYIMRGGDAFSLQALLGHSSLDMVKNYVNLWGTDLQKMHRQFSPVDYLFR